MSKKIFCPICHQKKTWQKDNPYRPFCSERCKLIDLGAWADESYSVPADNQSAPFISDPSEKDKSDQES